MCKETKRAESHKGGASSSMQFTVRLSLGWDINAEIFQPFLRDLNVQLLSKLMGSGHSNPIDSSAYLSTRAQFLKGQLCHCMCTKMHVYKGTCVHLHVEFLSAKLPWLHPQIGCLCTSPLLCHLGESWIQQRIWSSVWPNADLQWLFAQHCVCMLACLTLLKKQTLNTVFLRSLAILLVQV